ncbi:MAG: ABC transporter permease [Spirochaetaceae bacterium]|nr:MAG: ABC transporter permease [Spirochaetaceae bacterium]
MKRKLKRVSRRNEPYLFLVIIALALLIEYRSGQFFTANNIVSLASAFIVPGLFTIGAFLVLVSGGIDVSFPALASLSVYVSTVTLINNNYTGGVWLAFLLAILAGAILGAFNGLFIGVFRLPTLIVTLGSTYVFRGFMQGALNSVQWATIPRGMAEFGRMALFTATNPVTGLRARMPVAFLIFLFILILVALMLRYTMFGRSIYGIGGSEVSAHRAGYNVMLTRVLIYVMVGIIASIAAVIRVSMMQQLHPTNMLGMELRIIAGTVLGGTIITGGKGTLLGAMMGSLLIVIVVNSMILLGIPTSWRSVFTGALIIIGTGVSARQAVDHYRGKRGRVTEQLASEKGAG